MIASARRKPRYEEVPKDPAAALTVRQFAWPDSAFDWHFHPELELTLIPSGAGLRLVGDSVEQFENGDLCLVGANTPHCWTSHPGEPRGQRSLVIQFQPETWGASFWELPELRSVRELFQRARHGLLVGEPTRGEIGGMMRALARRRPGAWQRLTGLVALLLKLAKSNDCRPLGAPGLRPAGGPPANRRLSQVLSFIQANLGLDLRQKQVAQAVKMSPQSFSRFFKRFVGMTYIAYVNELRVRRVCRALLDSDETIAEAAYAAGFNNLSHFNCQFRRVKRMSPREYRRLARA